MIWPLCSANLQARVIRIARQQLFEVVQRVAIAARRLAVEKGLHGRHIRCRGRAQRHACRDARLDLAHEDEAGLDGVADPVAEQHAIRRLGRGVQRGRVLFQHDALQQLVRLAVLLLLDEHVRRDAATAVVRIHTRVARVVHPTRLAADVELAARDHGEASQHIGALVVVGHRQHELVADHLGAGEEIRRALEAHLGRAGHGDLGHQVLDLGVVGRGADADGDGHGQSVSQ